MARYSAWIGGKICGPFSLAQIAQNPQIGMDTRVIPEGKTRKDEWLHVRDVPEFVALLSPRSSAPPHPPGPKPPPLPTAPKPPPLPVAPASGHYPEADHPVSSGTPSEALSATTTKPGSGVLRPGLLFLLGLLIWIFWMRPNESRVAPAAIDRGTPGASDANAAAKQFDRQQAEATLIQQYQRYVRAGELSTEAVRQSEDIRNTQEPWNSPAKEMRRRNCADTFYALAREERNYEALVRQFVQQYGQPALSELMERVQVFPRHVRATNYCG